MLWACCRPEEYITFQIILQIIGTIHVRVKYLIGRHRYLSSNAYMLTRDQVNKHKQRCCLILLGQSLGQLSSTLPSLQTNKNVYCHALDELCHILLNKYPEDSGLQDSNQRETLYWGSSKEGRYFSDNRMYFSNLNWMRTWALVLLTPEKETTLFKQR